MTLNQSIKTTVKNINQATCSAPGSYYRVKCTLMHRTDNGPATVFMARTELDFYLTAISFLLQSITIK